MDNKPLTNEEPDKPTVQETTRQVSGQIMDAHRKVRAVKTTVFGSIIVICSIIASVYYGFSQGDFLVGSALLLMGAITGYIIWFDIKSATRKQTNRLDTPFEGVDTYKTTVVQSFPRTFLEANETVLGWLGPIKRTDAGGMSSTVLGAETVRGVENTLFVTARQLIGVAFIQADFDALQTGAVTGVLSQVSSFNNSAHGQQTQVSLINMKLWPQLIASIPPENYAGVLDSHFQWGVPLGEIRAIEVRNTSVNAGIFVHLHSGTTIKYASFLKDQIEPFVSAARTAGITIQ